MLINLKLASHAFRCGSQQWKFGVQNSFVQSIRSQMTKCNTFSKNALLNQQNLSVSGDHLFVTVPCYRFHWLISLICKLHLGEFGVSTAMQK